jgi:hypothetical protein
VLGTEWKWAKNHSCYGCRPEGDHFERVGIVDTSVRIWNLGFGIIVTHAPMDCHPTLAKAPGMTRRHIRLG